MVVDTSAILAVAFDEPHADWALGKIRTAATVPKMSAVNLTEALILFRSRKPATYLDMQAILVGLVKIEPVSQVQAEVAAWARLRYPLNLGDCFAYALAKALDEPLLTLDSDFRHTDISVVSP